MRLRTFPVFLAFLAMGFADAVGPFVSLAKKEFQLSNAVASLIPFVGFVMFGLLSIPMGVFQDKRGKKFVLMLGLVVALIGLLNAAFGLTSFARFLLTVLLVGAGAAILQVSGNPIMRDVSDPGKYARNLSLAQFVKAIGSLSGPMIPVLAAKYFGASWGVIFPIYAVALVVAVAAVAGLRVEEKRSEHQAATLRSCLALLSNGYVLMMVAAIFFYVGAEVSVSAGIPLYLKERFDIDINKVGLLGTGLFFTALTIGRPAPRTVLPRAHHRALLRRGHLELDCATEILPGYLRSLGACAIGFVRSGPHAGGGQLLRGGAGLCEYLPAGLRDCSGGHAGAHQ